MSKKPVSKIDPVFTFPFPDPAFAARIQSHVLAEFERASNDPVRINDLINCVFPSLRKEIKRWVAMNLEESLRVAMVSNGLRVPGALKYDETCQNCGATGTIFVSFERTRLHTHRCDVCSRINKCGCIRGVRQLQKKPSKNAGRKHHVRAQVKKHVR